MTDKLDTSKLVPLDVTGLEPIDEQSKPLDVSALEPLDVSGLEPVDAPPVQPVAAVEPMPVSTAFTPAAGSSSQAYTPVIPKVEEPVGKTIWNRNDGVFHKTIKPGVPIGIVYQGKKMMAVYDATTGKFKTEIDDQTKPIKGNSNPPPGWAAPFAAPITPDTFGKVELDPSEIQAFSEGRGALRSIRNTALRALPPTATSFAAFNAAGIPAAAWAGRFHPYAAPVGFVVGGGLAAMGVGAATDMAVNAMFPLDENDELNQILYPTQNAITQQGVAVAALRPSVNTLLGIAALEKAALAQAGKGAALNTALAGQHRLVEEITSDKPFSLGNVFAPGEMVKDAAHGAFLMHKATAMGKAFEYPGKVLGAKLSPAPRPQDATASTQELRAADQPLDTSGLEPVSPEEAPSLGTVTIEVTMPEGSNKPPVTAERKPPSVAAGQEVVPPTAEAAPVGNVRPYPGEPQIEPSNPPEFNEMTIRGYKKANQEWLEKYGKTHNKDGTPKSTAQPAPAAAEGNVPPRPKTPDVDTGTDAEWEAYRKDSKEWDSKYELTHYGDGSPMSKEIVEMRRRIRAEREAEEAAAAAQGQPEGQNVPPTPKPDQPAPVSVEAKPDTSKNVPPAPDQVAAGFPVNGDRAAQWAWKNSPEGQAHEKKFQAWFDQYGTDYNMDGTPKGDAKIPGRLLTPEERSARVADQRKKLEEIKKRPIPTTVDEAIAAAREDSDIWLGNTSERARQQAAKETDPNKKVELVNLAEQLEARKQRGMDLQKKANDDPETYGDIADAFFDEVTKIQQRAREAGNKPPVTNETPKSVQMIEAEAAQAGKPAEPAKAPEEPVIPEAKESSPEVQLAHLREQRDRLAATQPEPGSTQEAQLKKLDEAVRKLEEQVAAKGGESSEVGLVRNEGFTPEEVAEFKAQGLRSMKKRLAEMEAAGRGDSNDAKDLRKAIEIGERGGNPPKEPTEQIDEVVEPKEDPKDVAEREALWAQENPADTTEPSKETVDYEAQKSRVAGLEKQLAKLDKQKPNKYTDKQREKIKATLEKERAALEAMPVPAAGPKPKKERTPRKVVYDETSLRRITGRWFAIDVKNGGSKNLSLNQIKESMPHLYDKAVEMDREAEAKSAAEFKRTDAEIRRFAAEARKIADSDMTVEQKQDALGELDDRVTKANFGDASASNAVFVGIDDALLTKVENSPRPIDIREAAERDFPVDDPANGWQEGTGEYSKLRLNIDEGPQGMSTIMGIAIHMSEAKDAFKEGMAADALEMAKQGKGLAETLEGYARRRAKKLIDSFEQETGIKIGKSIEAEEKHHKTGEPIKGVPFPDSGPETEGLVNNPKPKEKPVKPKKGSREDLQRKIDELQEEADEMEENDPDTAEELRAKASDLQEKLDAMGADKDEQQATKPNESVKPKKNAEEASISEEDGDPITISGIEFKHVDESEMFEKRDKGKTVNTYQLKKTGTSKKGDIIGIEVGNSHLDGEFEAKILIDTGRRHEDGTAVELVETADLYIPESMKTIEQFVDALKKGTLTEPGPNWNNPNKPGRDAKAIKKFLDSVSGEGEAGQGAKPKPKVTPPDAGQGKDPKDAPFDYDKVLKAFNAVSDIGDYKPMGGTKAKAAGRIENMIKQLEKIFPDIREASLSEENLKSMPMPYDSTTRAEALAEPDIRAKTISRYLSRKMEPYRDKANAKDQPAEESTQDFVEDPKVKQIELDSSREARLNIRTDYTEAEREAHSKEAIKEQEESLEQALESKKKWGEKKARDEQQTPSERIRRQLDGVKKGFNIWKSDAKVRELVAKMVELEKLVIIDKKTYGRSRKYEDPKAKELEIEIYHLTKGLLEKYEYEEIWGSFVASDPTRFSHSQEPAVQAANEKSGYKLGGTTVKKADYEKWLAGRKDAAEPARDVEPAGGKDIEALLDERLQQVINEKKSKSLINEYSLAIEDTKILKAKGYSVEGEPRSVGGRSRTWIDSTGKFAIVHVGGTQKKDSNGYFKVVRVKDGVADTFDVVKQFTNSQNDPHSGLRMAIAHAESLRGKDQPAGKPAKPPVQEAAQEPAEKKYPIEKLEDALAEKGLKILRRNNTEDFVAEGGVEDNGRQRPTLVVGDTKITLASEGMEEVKGKVQIMDEQEKDSAGNVIYSIERIVTAPEGRGKGSASKALDELTEAADKAGLTLQLEPTPFRSLIGKGESLEKDVLIEWYKKYGFEQKTEGSDAILIRNPGAKPERPKGWQGISDQELKRRIDGLEASAKEREDSEPRGARNDRKLAQQFREELASRQGQNSNVNEQADTQYEGDVGRKKIKELEKLNERIDEIELFEAPEENGSRYVPEDLTPENRSKLENEAALLKEKRVLLEKDISENHKDLWGKKNADVLEHVRKGIKEHNEKFEPTKEWIDSHPEVQFLSNSKRGFTFDPKSKNPIEVILPEGISFESSGDPEAALINSHESFPAGTPIADIARFVKERLRVDPYSSPSDASTNASMLGQRIARIRYNMKTGKGETLDLRRDPNNDANDAFDMEERKARELDRRVKRNAENREAGQEPEGGRRGFIGIMDRAVSEARMRGEITDKEVEGLSRIVNYIGGQFFEGVKMSIRQGQPGELGQYDVANRIVTIFKDAVRSGKFEDTAGHEIGHHLEKFLPEGDRAALRKEWLAARKEFTDKWSTFGRLVGNAENWGRVKISPEAYEQAAAEFPTLSRFLEPVRNNKGKITHYAVRATEEMYRLFNPREWFAETFKDAVRGKLDSDPAYTGEQAGWKQKAIGLWNNIKTAFAQMFGKEQAKRILANFAKGRYKPENEDPSIYSEGQMSSKKDVEAETRLTPEERDAIDKERDDAREIARGEKPELSAGGKAWRSVVDHPFVSWFKPLSMRMRTIADLNPQSETLQQVVNDFSLIPGRDAEAADYNTQSSNMRNVFYNKLSKAFGPVLEDMRKMGPAELKEFNSLFIKQVEGRAARPVGGRVGEAINQVRSVLEEMHQYGIGARLKLGKVEGYFPRAVDADAVDADKIGFVRAATRAYEVQFERLKQEAKDEAAKNGTEYVEPETPDFDQMARDWRDAVLLGREGLDFEHGIFEEPRQGTKESYQKKREFTKDEALLFDHFREKDVERTIINYVGSLVRKAEVSRRIGVDNGSWGKMKSKMDKEGVDPKDIAEIEQLIKSNIGIGGKRIGESTQEALDFTKLVSNAAYLKLTGLLNITEAASIGIRTNSAYDSARAIVQMLGRTGNVVGRLTPEQTKNANNEIERIYGKGHDLASALAIEFGINTIDRGFGTVASGYHMDGGSDYQGKLNKASDGVYRMYGIHATESAKREVSLRIGADFIDTTIKWLEGTHNLQLIGQAMGKNVRAKNIAKDRLTELGLKLEEIGQFKEWVKKMRKGDEVKQLKDIMSDDPMAAKYRQALIIFNKQSSVQASRSSRTESANDTPLGRLFFQFSTFTNEWSAQHGRRMAEQTRKITGDNKYNASERMLAAGVAPAFALAMAATWGIRKIMNLLTGFEYKDGEKVPGWVKSLADAFVYTGMLGPSEILWKYLGRDQVPAGVVGDLVQKSVETAKSVIENPESNTARRNAARSGYRTAVVPALNAGLALATEAAPLPGKLAAGLAAQVIANNRTEKGLADIVAGEAQPRGSSEAPEPRTPPKPRPPSR
jgi:hypothetical protein